MSQNSLTSSTGISPLCRSDRAALIACICDWTGVSLFSSFAHCDVGHGKTMYPTSAYEIFKVHMMFFATRKNINGEGRRRPHYCVPNLSLHYIAGGKQQKVSRYRNFFSLFLNFHIRSFTAFADIPYFSAISSLVYPSNLYRRIPNALPFEPFLFRSCLVIRHKNFSDSSKFVKNSDEPEGSGIDMYSMGIEMHTA